VHRPCGRTCVVCCSRTCAVIICGGLIEPWKRTHLSAGWPSALAPSSHDLYLADFTINIAEFWFSVHTEMARRPRLVRSSPFIVWGYGITPPVAMLARLEGSSWRSEALRLHDRSASGTAPGLFRRRARDVGNTVQLSAGAVATLKRQVGSTCAHPGEVLRQRVDLIVVGAPRKREEFTLEGIEPRARVGRWTRPASINGVTVCNRTTVSPTGLIPMMGMRPRRS
jgi:hypothetical protein